MKPRPESCVRIEADLMASAIGEAELATGRRVKAHVDACTPCREDFERYRVIEGEVATIRSAEVETADVARARERLESRLLDLRSRLVAYEVFPSPLGDILIARSEQGVVLVEYVHRRPGERALRGSRLGRLGGVEAVEARSEVEGLYGELRDYIEGRSTRLGWSLDLRLARSEFQRAVLRATARIPYGGVVSYSGLAREIGRPRAVRAVAQALRWNPVPIAIPCHRVIGVSGALVGYAGEEPSRKQKLLALEGVPSVPARAHDFQIRRDDMYVLAPGETAYCLPTCSSVDVFPLGGTLFGSRQRAEAAGLLPCTSCRPDLHPLQN